LEVKAELRRVFEPSQNLMYKFILPLEIYVLALPTYVSPEDALI